jgi:hypothetical protein
MQNQIIFIRAEHSHFNKKESLFVEIGKVVATN